MKLLLMVVAASAIAFTAQQGRASASSAHMVTIAQWYVGGTLHRASATQWRMASHSDRLATSADWIAAVWGAQRVQRVTGEDMNRLRPYASNLVRCVDEAAPAAGNQRASELAAACIRLLGYS
jgi:hypothetical protein